MILIVNRSGEQCRSLARYLRAFGVDSEWVCSAAEAVEYLDEKAARVLILDQDLAGTSGLDFLGRLHATGRSASLDVIFYTDVASPDLARHAAKLGALDWIIRSPKSRQTLLSLVHQRVL